MRSVEVALLDGLIALSTGDAIGTLVGSAGAASTHLTALLIDEFALSIGLTTGSGKPASSDADPGIGAGDQPNSGWRPSL